MIRVTRLNGKQLYVNAEMIQFVEGTPDSVITLTDGTKIIALEPPEILVERILEYQRQVRLKRVMDGTGEA